MNPIETYVNDLDQFFEGKNFWQASLLRQLEGLTYEQALYKPFPDRHCIWEILQHICYWKHWAITYVKDSVKLNVKEENWAKLSECLNATSWNNEIDRLKKLQEDCKKIVMNIGDEIYSSSEEKIIFFRQLLYHDCYHTGQIGLIRVMQGLKPVE